MSRRERDDRGAKRPPAWPAGTFLNQIDPSVRDELLRLGRLRRYGSGEMVLREGEKTDQVVILLSGLAKVTAIASNGREALLALRVPGDIVGELAAIDTAPRSATVTACGDVTAREIGREQFHRFLDGRPHELLALAMTMSARLRTATRRRVELSSYHVRGRLARVIADLSREYGEDTQEGRIISIELTQTDLAAAIGASEAATHHALRELRNSGVLETGYRWLLLRRPDDLTPPG